jgi:hypothetical protein
MGIYAGVKNHFTLNKPEFKRFQSLAAKHRPGFSEWSVSDVFAGWTTVFVPEWRGTNAEFHRAVNERRPR